MSQSWTGRSDGGLTLHLGRRTRRCAMSKSAMRHLVRAKRRAVGDGAVITCLDFGHHPRGQYEAAQLKAFRNGDAPDVDEHTLGQDGMRGGEELRGWYVRHLVEHGGVAQHEDTEVGKMRKQHLEHLEHASSFRKQQPRRSMCTVGAVEGALSTTGGVGTARTLRAASGGSASVKCKVSIQIVGSGNVQGNRAEDEEECTEPPTRPDVDEPGPGY
ncbi:hypothetical protein AURDEDRAFT_127708 [Auricularia subglabra TFB-10046 SS5]|nr:hypothetical protein AURDEDRAFT_127708 [Auricularia subglabra TFB-10046 SS5]